MQKTYAVGLDIGSTTVKIVVLDENNRLLFSRYQRHHASIQKSVLDVLEQAKIALRDDIQTDQPVFAVAIT
ncbi:MAG: hypothetical protein LBL41_02245, partial [Bifidobacteriaceae bacterium]|nr:hypothetical protein [Bifidobacteriaceae bacterium]